MKKKKLVIAAITPDNKEEVKKQIIDALNSTEEEEVGIGVNNADVIMEAINEYMKSKSAPDDNVDLTKEANADFIAPVDEELTYPHCETSCTCGCYCDDDDDEFDYENEEVLYNKCIIINGPVILNGEDIAKIVKGYFNI